MSDQSGLIDGVQFDKDDPATRLFIAANYWREKADELKAKLLAAEARALAMEKDAERLAKESATEKRYADMTSKAWQREICEQGILFRSKTHWIDFMVLATQRVMALAKENGVRCCGTPDLCANMNCNILLRHRLSPAHAEYAAAIDASRARA